MAEYNRSIVQAPAATAARILIRGATVLSMDGDIGNLARGVRADLWKQVLAVIARRSRMVL